MARASIGKKAIREAQVTNFWNVLWHSYPSACSRGQEKHSLQVLAPSARKQAYPPPSATPPPTCRASRAGVERVETIAPYLPTCRGSRSHGLRDRLAGLAQRGRPGGGAAALAALLPE